MWFWPIGGLIGGSIGGLIMTGLTIIEGEDIKPVEQLLRFWNIKTWKTITKNLKEHFRHGLAYGLLIGLVTGAIYGLICMQIKKYDATETLFLDISRKSYWQIIGDWMSDPLLSGLLLGITLGLMLILAYSLILGIRGSEIDIEEKDYPNEGILLSVSSAIYHGAIIWVLFGSVWALMNNLLIPFPWMCRVSMFPILGPGNVFLILFGGLLGGGLVCIKHFTLRLMLYYEGYVPWNYARFLDQAAKHRFIQRIGGRYRFTHDLLRKHFAGMTTEDIKQLAED